MLTLRLKLPGVFESLPDHVAAVLGTFKPRAPTKAVVEFGEQETVVKSRPHLSLPVYLVTERKEAVVMANPLRFRDSGRPNITAPCAEDSKSMTPSLPNKSQRLVTNPTMLPMLTATEKQFNVLDMADTTAAMDFSEEAKRAMEILRESMNTVCYIYDADC